MACISSCARAPVPIMPIVILSPAEPLEVWAAALKAALVWMKVRRVISSMILQGRSAEQVDDFDQRGSIDGSVWFLDRDELVGFHQVCSRYMEGVHCSKTRVSRFRSCQSLN